VKRGDVRFLEVRHVKMGHAKGIEVGGGSLGVRDAGLLDSAVMAPRSGYYGSLSELAAVYLDGIAKNHPFVDGNKHAALFAADVFLAVNGFPLHLEREKWRRVVEGVAAGEVSRDELAGLLAVEMGDAVEITEDEVDV
jgi:death on curing protein